MHLWTKTALVLAFILGVAIDASAQCCSKKKAAAGADAVTASQKDALAAQSPSKDEPNCRGKALAATGMPLMTYKVGEKPTNCPKEAEKLAADGETAVRYVVGTGEFQEKAEALRAYTAALDEYLGTVTTVRYAVGDSTVGCPQAAAALARDVGEAVRFRVASYTFADEDAAQQAAEAARHAADKVVLKKLINGEEVAADNSTEGAHAGKSGCAAKAAGHKTAGAGDCATKKTEKGSCGASKLAARGDGCPGHKTAAEATASAEPASDRPAQCEFVVGDLKTCCEVTAKVELAQARIIEAHKAVAELAAKDGNGKPVAGI